MKLAEQLVGMGILSQPIYCARTDGKLAIVQKHRTRLVMNIEVDPEYAMIDRISITQLSHNHCALKVCRWTRCEYVC